MKKEKSKTCETPSTPTEGPSSDALLRLAEELGRIVGKFVADEMAKSSKAKPFMFDDLKTN